MSSKRNMYIDIAFDISELIFIKYKIIVSKYENL